MDTHRVAQLLRDLADAIEASDKAEERPSEPRKRRPKAAAFPAPVGIATDVDVARAAKMLRRRAEYGWSLAESAQTAEVAHG